MRDGSEDHARAVRGLAARLPEPLRPLAELAYDYLWSWLPGGREAFRSLDADRFALAVENPVRFLRNLPPEELDAAARDTAYVKRLHGVAAALPHGPRAAVPEPEVAFLCAEFGVHASLPTYSGGLGVLAGDYLKEASDAGFPLVAVGLLYRRGYFHQRIDLTGRQRESWELSDPDSLPAVRVTSESGEPLRVSVPVWENELLAGVWRVQVGRVPLYLLDTDLPENTLVERWVTSRLYEGTRALRLAQYAVLGVGAARALEAMGIEPRRYHLNEGHPALAAVAVAARSAPETPLAEALAAGRDRFVFTTHTPVPAGNETYSREELLAVLGRIPAGLGYSADELVSLCRTDPADEAEPAGLTPLAIRSSGATVGVSRRHGEVARSMWSRLTGSIPGQAAIGHVTNGVHLPTWMAPELRELLGRHLGEGWERSLDPAVWEGVAAIPDEELWRARGLLRARFVAAARARVVTDRLTRGEELPRVLAAMELFSEDVLTIGFARRLAAYKRLGLLIQDPERVRRIFAGAHPVQIVVAGKAHPLDDAGKSTAQRLIAFERESGKRVRAAFLEDYDLRFAPALVAGCDLWLNVPRPPLEASGTSGMKVALNGGLNVSVLDGWWPEAFDGSNGWAIDGDVDPDEPAQDARHASALYDLVEREVIPSFYDRDENGVPRSWLARVKRSLATVGRSFTTTRMLADYEERVYGRYVPVEEKCW
jgi:glycogen phosphorylase